MLIFFVEKNVRSFCSAKAFLIFFNKKDQCIWLYSRKTLNEQGPVVQSIVSLTSSLRGQLINCFTTL